jgi:hypothetical protein
MQLAMNDRAELMRSLANHIEQKLKMIAHEKKMKGVAPKTDWTKIVKNHVATFWEKDGCNVVRYTGRGGEFLVDLCAYIGERMELVIESEWNPALSATEEDFKKLFHFKAPL